MIFLPHSQIKLWGGIIFHKYHHIVLEAVRNSVLYNLVSKYLLVKRQEPNL